MKKTKSNRMLKPDKNFTPALADEGDELFPNGIFLFNITKMLSHIQDHPDEFTPERIAVKDHVSDFPPIKEDWLDMADISKPVILAEISPGRYNLIDGHHRVEKARRTGIEYLAAFWLSPNQHIQFLTTQKAYVAYVEYWNSKLEDLL